MSNLFRAPSPSVGVRLNKQFNNTVPAAGIVPYVKNTNNECIFLLGHERVSKKWSGFVGGYETSDGNLVNTAIREFNEETARVFETNLEFVRDKIISGNAFLITDKNNNRLIYIWFIEFPLEILNINIPQKFIDQLSSMTDCHFKEKLSLRWFNIQEIREHQNDILYKLKKSILDNYKKL